jgi:FkbM family methyltransferase
MSELPVTVMVRRVARHGEERVVRYRLGTADESVLAAIWTAGDYDLTALPEWPVIYDKYQAIAATGQRPQIIDGGGHIGLASVWFALEFPLAEVIALEPERDNFALLSSNVRGLSVTPIRAALTERFCHIAVTDPGEGTWAYRVTPAAHGNILGVPIAEFIDPASIFIVKLDIEGSERDVLRTAAAWLPHVPVLIVERHAFAGDEGEFGCLHEQSRHVHRVGENIVSVLL